MKLDKERIYVGEVIEIDQVKIDKLIMGVKIKNKKNVILAEVIFEILQGEYSKNLIFEF